MSSPDETQIRQQIDRRIAAIRAKDANALMALYARDLTTFDMVTPLANRGADSVRQRVENWFGGFTGDIDYELTQIEIAVAGDVAFDTHFVHVKGTNRARDPIDMWFRETCGWRKREGRWVVVHQHSSVPFDMMSGTARVDLKP